MRVTQAGHRGRLAVLPVTVGLALIGVQGPAAAAPIEHEHFSESFGDVEAPCGFDVRFHVDLAGTFLLVRHGDALGYAYQNVSIRTTWTGVESGRTMTERAVIHFQDQQVLDNGNGTLTITEKGTGRHQVFGADGKLLFVDSGPQWWTQTIDDAGTPGDPTDDELVDESDSFKDVGHDGGAGHDFCADLTVQIG